LKVGRRLGLLPLIISSVLALLVIVALSSISSNIARANGGQLRIDGERVGPYQLYAFSNPTPLRAGEVDLSFIVEDAETFETRFDVTIDVTATSLDYDVPPIQTRASRDQALDPATYQAAVFDLPRTGNWRFTLTLSDASGEVGTVDFEARASAERSFGWLPLVLAVIALPIIIGLVWFIAMSRSSDAEDQDESSEQAASRPD
jgi:hypothetical protein